MRSQLKSNQTIIDYADYGAGSKTNGSKNKTIGTIAINALSFPYQCRVMYRLVNFLGSKNILELGTSLGVSTLYLSKANNNAKVYTLEGDRGSFEIAKKVFTDADAHNILPRLGLFSETLQPTLTEMKTVDLAFIDGHHDKKATIKYFEVIKQFCHPGTAIIVDDIYWSQGMQKAWHTLKADPAISVSIDLFFCGILFFRKENREKEHFKIRPDKILFHL